MGTGFTPHQASRVELNSNLPEGVGHPASGQAHPGRTGLRSHDGELALPSSRPPRCSDPENIVDGGLIALAEEGVLRGEPPGQIGDDIGVAPALVERVDNGLGIEGVAGGVDRYSPRSKEVQAGRTISAYLVQGGLKEVDIHEEVQLFQGPAEPVRVREHEQVHPAGEERPDRVRSPLQYLAAQVHGLKFVLEQIPRESGPRRCASGPRQGG